MALRVVSLLAIAVPLAHSSVSFFKFSSFAVDELSSKFASRESLRFETCVLHAGWMTATVSRTVFSSSPRPWRLTSVTCGEETHLDLAEVFVADQLCSALVNAPGEQLAQLAAETVRTCYGLSAWSTQTDADVLSALVASEAFAVTPGSRPSILAFALAHVQRPEPARVVCETANSCTISRSTESFVLRRNHDGGLVAASITCTWGSLLNFFPLHPVESLQNADLRRLSAELDVAALCSTILDMLQSALNDRTAPPFENYFEECSVKSGIYSAISIHRKRAGPNRPWELNSVTCGFSSRRDKASLVADAKTAGIVARLEAHLEATWRNYSVFPDFQRKNYSGLNTPDYCHFLRLDQGSGLSFNQLCR